MGLFEYIMVLTSILIGLGVAELLNGVVRMLRSEFKEGIYLPQLFWAAYLFLFLIVIWWSRWDLNQNFHWTFTQLLLSLAGPVVVFILSGLVFPHNEQSRVYYFKHQKTFFTLLPFAAAIGLLHEILIEGTPVLSSTTLMGSMLVILSVIPRFSERDWVHLTCSVLINVLFLGWVLDVAYLIAS